MHRQIRTVILALCAALLVAASLLAAGKPKATVAEPVKDAGTVPKGEKITSDFAIKNEGDADLQITNVQPACGCTVADFDKVIKLNPGREPYHWQRGISLYYAGEFERGRKQFEKHKTVNPDDVENAAWHFLCVARASGVEKARRSLIPVTGDARVPMAQVQLLFAGKATPEDVLAAANAGNPGEAELRRRLCYAHLYIGLYHEATGNGEAAKEHILLAAEKYAGDDYMGDVARVHAARWSRRGRGTSVGATKSESPRG
jgi:lipoprotein NlpI